MLKTHPMTSLYNLHFASGIIVLVISFFMSISGVIMMIG